MIVDNLIFYYFQEQGIIYYFEGGVSPVFLPENLKGVLNEVMIMSLENLLMPWMIALLTILLR